VPSSRLADAHPTVLYALAQTRHKLRRWAEAAAAYDACAAAETNVALRARALSGAGVAKAKAGDVEGAARALEAAVALRPEDAGAGVSLAAVRKRAGDLEGALEALEKAARVAPEVRERFVAPLEREMERRKEGKRAAGKRGKQGKRGKRRE
jgi:YidC/Oxa1 family membrane protein insertase